jgi:hypothetical protein
LTRKEFCLQHGLQLGKFTYWIARWKDDQGSESGGFVALGAARNSDSSIVSLIYPNGVRLEVSAADLNLLSALIALG